MPKLKFIGTEFMKRYSSVDPGTNGQISVEPGQYAEMSQAKADQILKDFPKAWELADAPGKLDHPEVEEKVVSAGDVHVPTSPDRVMSEEHEVEAPRKEKTKRKKKKSKGRK